MSRPIAPQYTGLDLRDMFPADESKYRRHSPPAPEVRPYRRHERAYYRAPAQWRLPNAPGPRIQCNARRGRAHGHGNLGDFNVGGTQVCGRVSPENAGAPGEAMLLDANVDHMHLIDPETDLVL